MEAFKSSQRFPWRQRQQLSSVTIMRSCTLGTNNHLIRGKYVQNVLAAMGSSTCTQQGGCSSWPVTSQLVKIKNNLERREVNTNIFLKPQKSHLRPINENDVGKQQGSCLQKETYPVKLFFTAEYCSSLHENKPNHPRFPNQCGLCILRTSLRS